MRILLAAVLIGIVATQLDANCVPFGLRLAYGEYYTQQGGPNQLYVMFNTYGNCSNSYVGFGSVSNYNKFSCTTAFINFTWAPQPYFNCTVYTCPVSGIDFNRAVLYSVYSVDATGFSYPYLGRNITTVLRDVNTNLPVQFLTFGDWSYYNASQYPQFPPITNCLNLMKSYNLEDIQGMIFLGDQAYNLNSQNGTYYMQLLTMLEPYASVWPFIPTPGNHESVENSNIYVYNLTYYAPNCNSAQLYYTFQMGPVTFVSFDPQTIVYQDPENETTMQFLVESLTQTIASANTTYVIPFSHYPFMCSDPQLNPNCSYQYQIMYPIMQVLYQFSNIPLYLSGHAHLYERQFPVNLAGQVVDSNLFGYNNLKVPVMILEGAAGTNNSFTTSTYSLQPFTAVSSILTGFGIFNVSSEGIFYRHILAVNCTVADSFTLTYFPPQPEASKFPIWAIILLSILGAIVIGVLAWFIWWKCRKSKNTQEQYRTMEVGSYQNSV